MLPPGVDAASTRVTGNVRPLFGPAFGFFVWAAHFPVVYMALIAILLVPICAQRRGCSASMTTGALATKNRHTRHRVVPLLAFRRGQCVRAPPAARADGDSRDTCSAVDPKLKNAGLRQEDRLGTSSLHSDESCRTTVP